MSPMEKTGQSANNTLRLDKFLCLCGVESRSKARKLIQSGKVRVNNQIVKDPGFKINPFVDQVFLRNKKLRPQQNFYYKFFKPVGYVTSLKDPKHRVITELFPEDLPGRSEIFPVGRLDMDAEGLLILTNDGLLAHRILHPKWKLPKTYELIIKNPLTLEQKQLIESGIELSDGKTLPCKITCLNSNYTELRIEVFEGRYHLLKRMFKAVGNQTLHIKRIAIGCVELGDLKPGEIKPLSEKEIFSLKKALKLL